MKGNIKEIRIVTDSDASVFFNSIKSVKTLFEWDKHLDVEIQFSTACIHSGELMYSAFIVGRER